MNKTNLDLNDVVAIVQNYGLKLSRFKAIQGGASNTSYLLHTEQGDYVLTLFNHQSVTQALTIARLLSTLVAGGFPTSTPLPTINNTLVTTYLEKPVFLKKYLSGQVKQDLDEAMLRQVGVVLAQLHQIPAPDYIPQQHPNGRHAYPQVIGCNINPVYETWLNQQLITLNQNFPPKIPYGLIHGDLFYDNILFEGGKLKAIIDFEDACFYPLIFDVGMTILGTCITENHLNLEKASALVAGYQQIRPLTSRERDSLQSFTQYAAISTSYWRYWKYYIHIPTPEKKDKPWQMVRLVDAIGSIANSDFLERVFKH